MNSINYVKSVYFNSGKNKFSMNESGELIETSNTREIIESFMNIKFPIYGKQFLEDKERPLNIFFDSSKSYNTSICSLVETNEDCVNFITLETIKKFWSNVSIPENIVPEDYYTKFWDYKINIYIGNIVLYKEKEKNISVLPYYVEFLK